MYTNNPYTRNCPSLYRGIVEDNQDPDGIGRCKIRVPSVHGELNYPVDILPWARPIALSPIGKGKGSVNIPDVGDIVWVFFEGSVKDYPIYLGGTYSKNDIDIDPNRVDFYIEDDTKISYDREEEIYTITIGQSEVKIEKDKVTAKVDSTEMYVNSSGVRIQGNLIVSGAFTAGDCTMCNCIGCG